MGAGASTASPRPDPGTDGAPPQPPKEAEARVTFSNAALQRRKARKAQRQKAYEYALMSHYDKSKTGALNKEEVTKMVQQIMAEKNAEAAAQITEEDIDTVMRIGGANCKTEITPAELPLALSVLETVKEKNTAVVDLFKKYDTDESGTLPYAQLKPLLQELNEGEAPTERDIQYVLKQAEAGAETGIGKSEIKSAIACWYCLCDEGRDEV